MTTTETPFELGQYLTFTLSGEDYAVAILRVKELIRYETVTHVPMTLPFIRGVINLRGSVVPVVDLAVKFGQEPSPVTKETCIVIVEVELEGDATVLGIVVDRVQQVLELSDDEIEPPPTVGTLIQIDFLVGLGKVGDRFVLILDLDRVLSSSELMAAASLPAVAGAIHETSDVGAGAEEDLV